MQSFLSLRDTASRRHENTVEEIRVTVMQFTADLRQCTSEQCTERLFLSGSNVTEDTNVLRENVLSRTKNSDRVGIGRVRPRRIRRNGIDSHFFEFGKNAADLETFLEVVVLI